MSVPNANAGRNGLSSGIELTNEAAELAADEAMEGQFVSFLEDCVSGAGWSRNGCCGRKALAKSRRTNVRVPRARLAIHSLRNGRRLIAVEAECQNRFGRNRKLTGLDELTAGEMESLGMER